MPELTEISLVCSASTAVKVSVVMPVYNAQRFLRTSINSVAAQTFRNFEVIVVDDGSTDGSAESAREILTSHGLQHTIIPFASNVGPSAARNRGVATARGEQVAFLDADDEWLPEKLERQVSLMDAHPEVTLCGCQADLVDPSGTVVRPLYTNLPTLLPDGWKRLMWECFIATPCAMVRRADLATEPFDTRLRIGEDRDLWIRMAKKGVVGLVNSRLVIVREWSGGFMASQAQLMVRYTLPMIQRHLVATDSLSLRERARIYALLHSQIGKGLRIVPGQRWRRSGHLLLALLLGHRPVDNLRHLVLTLPGARSAIGCLRPWLDRAGQPGRSGRALPAATEKVRRLSDTLPQAASEAQRPGLAKSSSGQRATHEPLKRPINTDRHSYPIK